MRSLKNHLITGIGLTVVVVALILASAPIGNSAPSDKDVRVINTTLEPVPTAAQGTTTIAGNVGITGTPTVTLAPGANVGINGTVAVMNINDAAQPFQASASADQSGTNVSTLNVATVPAGKRLVIEWVTMGAQVPPGQHAEILSITTSSGTGGHSHSFVIHPQPDAVIGDAIFRANQSLRLYANPGTTVSALFRRNTSAGTANWGVTISGYLVDVP